MGAGPGDFGVAHTDYYFLGSEKGSTYRLLLFSPGKIHLDLGLVQKCQKTHFAEAPQAPKMEKLCNARHKNGENGAAGAREK